MTYWSGVCLTTGTEIIAWGSSQCALNTSGDNQRGGRLKQHLMSTKIPDGRLTASRQCVMTGWTKTFDRRQDAQGHVTAFGLGARRTAYWNATSRLATAAHFATGLLRRTMCILSSWPFPIAQPSWKMHVSFLSSSHVFCCSHLVHFLFVFIETD